MMDLSFRILIVDDVADNIQVAMSILREQDYDFSYAQNGDEALALLAQEKFDLVLLDIMMPGIDGFEVCRRLKMSDTPNTDVPVIFLTARVDADSVTKGFEMGAVDYITKPFHPAELLSRVKNHLELYRSQLVLRKHNLALETKIKYEQRRLLGELEETQKEIIYLLTELMESTSDETGRNIRRVSECCALLARLHPAMGEEDAELLLFASPMHDIGKITIPQHILHKPAALDAQEFEIMKRHTTNAHELLKPFKRKILKAADIIAYEHHERYDGTGYPRGLKGESIHIYGRIVALVDVFDALMHKRVYKEAWSIEEAVAYIKNNSAAHFDPQLVRLFLDHLDEFVAIAQRNA